MIDVKSVRTSRLSTFRTNHQFLHYGEFCCLEEFVEFRLWAQRKNLPILILGNGSNVLYTRNTVNTLVLKNRLRPTLDVVGRGTLRASSSCNIMKILKYCERESLDSFYFLASVPATVGGAIAMNAGGARDTIFDFLDSVTYWNGAEVVTRAGSDFERGHRLTEFTGRTDKLILEAVFQFSPKLMDQSEIQKRIDWCHSHQDLSAPNCGSVFRECNRTLMKYARWLVPFGIRIPCFQAQYSRKVNNWIICRNGRSWPIVTLVRAVQFLHRCFGSRAVPELIEVD